jgi:predicted ferric reductase
MPVKRITAAGGLFLAAYISAVLAPLAVAVIHSHTTNTNFVYELGKCFALTGIMIIFFQVVLASRLKFVEKNFGFDILIRFHKNIVVFGGILVLLHPVLLAVGGLGAGLIFRLNQPWYVLLGKAGLVIVLINIIASIFRKTLGVKFENWRILHDITGALIFAAVFVHSGFTGRDIRDNPALAAAWVILPALAMLLLVYHRLVRPLRLRRFKVTGVIKEANDVWTVKMAPLDGKKSAGYVPGQFQFITFYRQSGLPTEEHHWTISSSPSNTEYLSSTIKNLGDFTSTIGLTKPGDEADIHMPFGRFSYMFNPEAEEIVFITGGIGITPVMSMLRHMRDEKKAVKVTLLYANRDTEDIIFRDELEKIRAGGLPLLRVVHILSRPSHGWNGETGHIDPEKISRLCGDSLKGGMFYACGPGPLVEAVVKSLKAAGVKDEQLDTEVFSLVD